MLEHTSLSEEERIQIVQTIEMFEVTTQTQPDDYQSLEILKDAYLKVKQPEESLRISRKLAEAYFNVAFSMGRCLNTPPINLAKVRVPEEIMALVSRDVAKANKLVPIARLNGKLFVTMADPISFNASDVTATPVFADTPVA